MKKQLPLKCTYCGKFVAYEDIAVGWATHIMVTPESAVSYETWVTECKKCKEKEKKKGEIKGE